MLAILTTHPIQYQVPLWQALAKDGRVPFAVWYLTRHGVEASHDREFGKSFAWDLDMLSGYPHQFLDVMPGATPNSFWKCRLRESLEERLKESGAKVLWIQGWQVAAYWQAAWAAKRAGVEVWLRGESNDLAPAPPLWKRGIKRIILGQLFRRVDRFLYIGTANKRLYQEYGVSEDRLYSAPYAVDNARFASQAATLRENRSSKLEAGLSATGPAGAHPLHLDRGEGQGEVSILSPSSQLPATGAHGPRSLLRRNWNIPEDAFCVLFCGKFIPKKRPMDLVEAAKLMLEGRSSKMEDGTSMEDGSSKIEDGVSGSVPKLLTPLSDLPSIHLLFVGSGELGAELREQYDVVFDAEATGPKLEDRSSKLEVAAPFPSPARSANPQSPNSQLPSSTSARLRATFAGFLNQTEISRAYVAADCLVLPSDYGETWGLVVNEAMASGLPCIISNQCGCAEDLGNKQPNLVFPCGDVASLADCLLKMASRPVSAAHQPPSLNETVATVIALCANRR